MLVWKCINGHWTAHHNGRPLLTLLAGPFKPWMQPDSLQWALDDFRKSFRATRTA